MGKVIAGATLIAPFAILELVNRRAFHEEFPFLLFTFMSLHALLIVVLLSPVLRRFRAERRLSALKLGHWIGLAVALVLVFAYASVISDQLPCFMGVPNCD